MKTVKTTAQTTSSLSQNTSTTLSRGCVRRSRKESTSLNLKKMERGVKILLEGMGVNLKDDNFRETPRRVAAMYAEMLSPPDVSIKVFPTSYDQLVLVRNHTCWGICPHHLMPIKYSVSLGYIPNEKAIGLSKLPRIVNLHSYKPLLQEDFTHQIVNALTKRVKTKGAGCVVRGEHGCMGIRGVRTTGDAITSAMRGVFLEKSAARAEFLALLAL